eukprot:1948956-Rhodomonas_salina.8
MDWSTSSIELQNMGAGSRSTLKRHRPACARLVLRPRRVRPGAAARNRGNPCHKLRLVWVESTGTRATPEQHAPQRVCGQKSQVTT